MMKNKRAAGLILVLIILVSFCGCSGGVYAQADQQYLVSAIAFERNGSSITAYAETVVVNTESTKQGVTRKVVSANGDTPRDSVINIASKISKPLLFDHCGLVLLDTELSSQQISEIIDYCEDNEEINLAAYMAVSREVGRLIGLEPVSTLSIGYDIMGVIDRVQSVNGIEFNNRYYEVRANRLRHSKCFILPDFSVQQGAYQLDGADIYIENRRIKKIDIDKTVLYSIITDNFSSGSFDGFMIDSSKSYFDCSYSSGVLDINLKIRTELKKGNREDLKNDLIRFIDDIREYSGEDLFGFTDRIYRKDKKVYEKIKNNIGAYYSSAKINVRVEEK